ncbi:bifunctional (p)ppGpp synthetase/guanosine-3',5'-bis(diphosphate) 3'-pyrophosphohydrolase [Candidatus Kaiserbacteria bacterium]|nr:bifunctional (p)ppGpp synthetase/guanosine-3',5'-bis(diphosphate) 3'-pyrophosphohydrolase [Candidatus Kaiserbacteria bacterium]
MLYTYRIEQAIRAATILHKDQVRKGDAPIPYISHLFSVALITSEYAPVEDLVITALLHDTLEDTDYTAEELQDDFGGEVRVMVETLSEPQSSGEIEYSWQDRKNHYLKKLKEAPEEVLIVAAADKIHNLRSIVEDYYENHQQFLADFGNTHDKRINFYEKLSELLNERLSNPIINEFNNVFAEYKKFIHDIEKSRETEF